ncbi:MAG TPA: hypothetical protein ENN63_06695 [Bacteroidetes bacterium]|nr:hypothetical protein [Bacteroidota bacterium]
MKTIGLLILIFIFTVFQSCGPEEDNMRQRPLEIHHIGNSYFSVFHLCEETSGGIPDYLPQKHLHGSQAVAGDNLPS